MICQVEALRSDKSLFIALIFADSLKDCKSQAEILAEEKQAGRVDHFDITEP